MEPRSADWRQDAPTQPQCSRVWQLDLRIRERFKTPEEYFAFCQRQFESGDQGYTKGGLSPESMPWKRRTKREQRRSHQA